MNNDWMSLLMNAEVVDEDDVYISDVTGIHIVGGKLSLTVNLEIDDDDEIDDPDGGEEITEDDEKELDPTEETGNVEPFRAVGGKHG